jgi:Flp pilus assembly protein CpaB
MEIRASSFRMNDRFRNIVLALVFGAVAAVLVVAYVHHYKRHVNAQGQLVRVLVASGDLTPGTAGSDIGSHLRFKSVLRADLVPGAVQTKAAVSHLYVSQPIYAGEQISMNRFASVAEPGIRGEISGKQRLIQVPGDNDQLLAGTLQAGDFVDVVASVKVNAASGQQAIAQTILRGVRVLQPAKKSSGSNSSLNSSNGPSVILAVRDTDVPRLFYVLKNADWSLVLRPRFASSSAASNASASSVLGGK